MRDAGQAVAGSFEEEEALERIDALRQKERERDGRRAPGTYACSKIENGQLVIPDAPGWGIAPNEESLKAHRPKQREGLDYGRRKS